jgi:hypothetical protein
MPIMPINSEDFLDLYANALNTFEPQIVTSLCLPPIIMNDKSKKTMTSKEDLEQIFSQMFARFNQAGIKQFVLQLQQTLHLSDTLLFLRMRWQFHNENKQICVGCATSCTLQKILDNQLKVIVMIIDDDENKLAKILTVQSNL